MTRVHLLAVLVSSASALQPVLRFRDPKTRGDVVLIGCMHYNPASIALASSIVREEASKKRLRACVVESCPTRWNSTLAMQPQGSLYRALFDNEMQAAAEVAEEYGCMVKELLGSARARLLRLLRPRLATLGGSTLVGRGWASERPATASGARASHLQRRRFHCLPPFRYGRPVELGDQAIEDTGRRIVQLLALTLVQLLTPAGWQALPCPLAPCPGLGSVSASCWCVCGRQATYPDLSDPDPDH